MTAREALDKLTAGIDSVVDFDEALEVLNDMVNRPTEPLTAEGNSMWEQRYKDLRATYEKRWGEYTRPDTVKSVVGEAISSGFTREGSYTEPISLDDLDMQFNGSTE